MYILGIDPGKKGVAIIIDNIGEIREILQFKFDRDNLLWFPSLTSLINRYEPELIFIEKVHGRGGVWGATQNFNFGFIYGQIIGAVREHTICPITFIEPKAWQSKYHIKSKVKETAKERTLKAYKKLFKDDPIKKYYPSTKKFDDNILDAFMIASFALTDITLRKVKP